jgi:hypothetical protein
MKVYDDYNVINKEMNDEIKNGDGLSAYKEFIVPSGKVNEIFNALSHEYFIRVEDATGEYLVMEISWEKMKWWDVDCFDNRFKIKLDKESFDKIYGNDDIETIHQFIKAIEDAGGIIKDYYA